MKEYTDLIQDNYRITVVNIPYKPKKFFTWHRLLWFRIRIWFKRNLLIAFTLLTTQVMAQDTLYVRPPVKHWPSTVLCAVSVIAGATGDGFNSRAMYNPGHLLCAVSYTSLIAIPFTGRVDWKMPVTYGLLRYALFDLCYNLAAKRKLNYEGGKNYWDESVGKMPFGALSTTKFISFGAVIYLNAKHKKS